VIVQVADARSNIVRLPVARRPTRSVGGPTRPSRVRLRPAVLAVEVSVALNRIIHNRLLGRTATCGHSPGRCSGRSFASRRVLSIQAERMPIVRTEGPKWCRHRSVSPEPAVALQFPSRPIASVALRGTAPPRRPAASHEGFSSRGSTKPRPSDHHVRMFEHRSRTRSNSRTSPSPRSRPLRPANLASRSSASLA